MFFKYLSAMQIVPWPYADAASNDRPITDHGALPGIEAAGSLLGAQVVTPHSYPYHSLSSAQFL
jgi:hypothetical protein